MLGRGWPMTTDIDHASASQWLNQNAEPLLTTNYIVDETLISGRLPALLIVAI
jgi:hypothetical protein